MMIPTAITSNSTTTTITAITTLDIPPVGVEGEYGAEKKMRHINETHTQ